MKNCGNTVKKALEQVPGVRNVTIDFPVKKAYIVGSASVNDLILAVEDVGFAATENSVL